MVKKVPILDDHEERAIFMRCFINGLFCCNHVHGINSPHWKASNKVGRGTKAHLIQGRIWTWVLQSPTLLLLVMLPKEDCWTSLYFLFSWQMHKCLWEILKVIQDEYPSITAAGHSLEMKSVADLMDSRLLHTLFSLTLALEGMKGSNRTSYPFRF